MKAQLSQHNKSKERQIRKFKKLQLKTKKAGIPNWQQKTTASTHDETQNRWVKNLSDRELTHPEKEVLAKGLNFAVTPQEVLYL